MTKPQGKPNAVPVAARIDLEDHIGRRRCTGGQYGYRRAPICEAKEGAESTLRGRIIAPP